VNQPREASRAPSSRYLPRHKPSPHSNPARCYAACSVSAQCNTWRRCPLGSLRGCVDGLCPSTFSAPRGPRKTAKLPHFLANCGERCGAFSLQSRLFPVRAAEPGKRRRLSRGKSEVFPKSGTAVGGVQHKVSVLIPNAVDASFNHLISIEGRGARRSELAP